MVLYRAEGGSWAGLGWGMDWGRRVRIGGCRRGKARALEEVWGRGVAVSIGRRGGMRGDEEKV